MGKISLTFRLKDYHSLYIVLYIVLQTPNENNLGEIIMCVCLLDGVNDTFNNI